MLREGPHGLQQRHGEVQDKRPGQQGGEGEVHLGYFGERGAQGIHVQVFVDIAFVGHVGRFSAGSVLWTGFVVVIDGRRIRHMQLRQGLRAIEAQMQVRTRHPREEERDGEKQNDPAPGGVHGAGA